MAEKKEKKKDRFSLLILLFVFATAIFLRVWRLGSVPATLFGDELDVGLHAYSILTTGRDYYANSLPIIFQSFAEYRLPMQLYLAVPFISLFGLNEWGVRLASVFMGVLALALFYLLMEKLFNRKAAFIALALLTISPWHIMFSRQANDSGFLLPFLIGGLYFFLKGLKNYSFLIVSSLLFALGFYAYATAAVFIPLFIIFLTLIYRRQIFAYPFRKLVLVAVVGLLVLAPYLKSYFQGTTKERYSYLTQSSTRATVFEVEDLRRWSNSEFARLLHNKKTVAFKHLSDNYFSAFSTQFLFIRGDPNPRHSTGLSGHLFKADAILIMAGLVYLYFMVKRRSDTSNHALLLFAWLFIAPIPSALTADGGDHAARLILMLPPLVALSSLGLNLLLSLNWKSRLFSYLIVLIILFESVAFLHGYFVIWPNTSWKHWQTGFKEAIEKVVEEEGKYDKVYMDNTYEPMLQRFLFWSKYDMATFHKQFKKDVHEPNISTGIDGFALEEKYYFGELQKPLEGWISKDIMVVASAQNAVTNPDVFVNANLKLISETRSPDGLPVFYVYTSK